MREGRVAAVGVRDYDWPRKAAAVYKVFAALPHSSPPMRGKELERQGLREGRVAAVGVRDYDRPRKAAAVYKVFAALPPSPPPLRRGQGWWFAVLRSGAAAIKMRRRHLISTV